VKPITTNHLSGLLESSGRNPFFKQKVDLGERQSRMNKPSMIRCAIEAIWTHPFVSGTLKKNQTVHKAVDPAQKNEVLALFVSRPFRH
jgi:hypothetical protein